jgi:hypothetical protein
VPVDRCDEKRVFGTMRARATNVEADVEADVESADVEADVEGVP